jgi:hypothetical protein
VITGAEKKAKNRGHPLAEGCPHFFKGRTFARLVGPYEKEKVCLQKCV